MKKLFAAMLSVVMAFLLCSCSLFDAEKTSADTTSPDALTITITEEDAQKIINLVKEITQLKFDQMPMDEIKAFFAEQKWINLIQETLDGGLTIGTTFGVTGVWTPENEDTIGASCAAADAGSFEAPCVRTVSLVSENCYDIDKIAILCPYASEDPHFRLDEYGELADYIDAYDDCAVDWYYDEEVSLELLKNLDEYDMVWFYSHGALSCARNGSRAAGEDEPYTMTGEFADSPLVYAFLSEDFRKGRTIVSLNDGRIGVGGEFYRHYYSDDQMDGMFFHFGSCNSMRTRSLADGLLSRGAAWVEGWSESVYFTNDLLQFSNVVDSLVDGDTVDKALRRADAAAQRYDFYQEECLLTGAGNGNYTLGVQPEGYQPPESTRGQDPTKLPGTYTGTYKAGQGVTGLTLSVYKTDDVLDSATVMQTIADAATECSRTGGSESRKYTVTDIRKIVRRHPGEYIAFAHFYPVSSNPDVEDGIYTMAVKYDESSGVYTLTGRQWIEHDTYGFMNFNNVSLKNGTLTGSGSLQASRQ